MATIHEQFLEIADRLRREGHEPVRVIFSNHGYDKARMEGGDSFDGKTAWTSYMGLPYTIRSDMSGEIGLDYQFEKRPDAVTVELSFDARSGYMSADGKRLVGEPVQIMQIVGSKLTAAQICDLCRGWLDSDDATHWGAFEKGLDRLIEQHGRFE